MRGTRNLLAAVLVLLCIASLLAGQIAPARAVITGSRVDAQTRHTAETCFACRPELWGAYRHS